MMSYLQQVLFVGLLVTAIFIFVKKVKQIKYNINLGKDLNLNNNVAQRFKNMLIFALGQKKMFSKPIVAILHLFVYVGFVVINIEIIEIILDGILGSHRLFAPFLSSFYTIFINLFEILALTVAVACLIFLIRRNIIKVQRFTKPELNGFPFKDANIILITEIVLMSLFLMMNSVDLALQKSVLANHYTGTDSFIVSGQFSSLFEGLNAHFLQALERIFWWLHIIGILAFLNYLPYSKHLHIVLAFPNSYYSSLTSSGLMENMPQIANEVKIMFQPELANAISNNGVLKFGAKDATDLSWKSLMDAYSCSECGRCTEACPANITGKLLSPRKIMMDTRDRIEEIGKAKRQNGIDFEDGKSLLGDYISVEELRACTTCQACVQECPINISPLNIIHELRRSLVMEDSNVPNEWAMMFSNIENNQAPWKFSPDDRANWTNQ